jgi:putative selenate reductase
MEPTQLRALLERIAGEFGAISSIFGIPEAAFRRAFELESSSPGLALPGGRASLPVGPAAGPHSQLAPNLIAAYLAGARVFELKTVQVNDELDIEKPCIDARDEGHNTEWSTELSLEDAREEYLRGWIVIHLLASVFSSRPRDFVFNASVGYTLDGIRSQKVDAFLEGLKNPSKGAEAGFWNSALRDIECFLESGTAASAFGSSFTAKARDLLADFPSEPIPSVTISTMHGCPPDEIERIASYLIEEKGFHVYVKLNPTLLGYDTVRSILDTTGWKHIEIDRGLFDRDLKMPQAQALASSLARKAESRGLSFGLKLSNTLANANTGGFLPGNERYMSGRALFPITIRLAAELASALTGWKGRFSFCGGVSALNAEQLAAAGLGPLTAATELLKPGGYLRLTSIAVAAARGLRSSPSRPDAAMLSRLADEALSRPEYRFGWKKGSPRIQRPLPVFDCFAAPCIESCPVRQKVPEYLRLGAAGEFSRAFDTITGDNPLPCITGTLCDHVCQEVCSRNDYEGSVSIREAKLECALSAEGGAARVEPSTPVLSAGKAAVVGAGPAGLSCAYHLALAGVPVTVFDERRVIGGVVANVIPSFRITRRMLESDIGRIGSAGVEFRLGVRVESLDRLEAEGYASVFIGAGAPLSRSIEIEGDGVPLVDALTFLQKSGDYHGARHVVVAGGGNTAMDAARAALRLPAVESVTISYRRRREDMSADREELEIAEAEGARILELTLPERASPVSNTGAGPFLSLRIMESGPPDASGRRIPIATDRTTSVECDLLITAVGEAPDRGLFERLGLPIGPEGGPVFDEKTMMSPRRGVYVGGDAARGPSSIIAAAADGRRAALAILEAAGIERRKDRYKPRPPDARKLASRGDVITSLKRAEPGFLAREAERCLECDSACLRCVEVCPNRANIAVPAGGAFAQSLQILHIDRLCNECGNCGVFCPYEGEPFRGKPTLFSTRDALIASRNAGFAFVFDADPPDGARLHHRDAEGGAVRVTVLDTLRIASVDHLHPIVRLAMIVYEQHPYLLGGAR